MTGTVGPRRHPMRLAAIGMAILVLGAPLSIRSAEAQDPATREFVDSAGRVVQVPATVSRVFAAGPPASALLYTLAPDRLLGWVREPTEAAKAFMPQAYADLPTHGRLTGRGPTANFEDVLLLDPDVIIDVGTVDETYISLADRVQEQTGIPYVLMDGRFANTADTYRLLGELIGEEARAEELASYAERTFGEVETFLETVPPERRPRVYYGRGPDGLETGLGGSINLEVLGQVGAANVAAAAGTGGITAVSPEQVLAWNPGVILTQDPGFYGSVGDDPLWQGVAAVQDGHVYQVPTLPFGWFDTPPGVNRLIGVRWLTAVLYPEAFEEDLGEVTRDFYSLFYHVDLTDAQLDTLLEGATSARP